MAELIARVMVNSVRAAFVDDELMHTARKAKKASPSLKELAGTRVGASAEVQTWIGRNFKTNSLLEDAIKAQILVSFPSWFLWDHGHVFVPAHVVKNSRFRDRYMFLWPYNYVPEADVNTQLPQSQSMPSVMRMQTNHDCYPLCGGGGG